MREYIVTYLDSKRGDTVMTWRGRAEDEGDALDRAFDEDYYFGRLVSVEED